MIVTERFVYIHLHKSGGTFVNEALVQYFPGARVVGYHLPRQMTPPEYRQLPVLGFVRNPWSYYVSWYSFQRGLPKPNALYRCLSEDGRLGFKDTIVNMLELGSGGAKLDLLLPQLPESLNGTGFNLPRSALADIRQSQKGFYSFLVGYMFGGPGSSPVFIGKTEFLRNDLLAFMQRIGQPLPRGFAEHVTSRAESNVSDHAPYQNYYDQELREMVAQRDAELIRSFGYQFGAA